MENYKDLYMISTWDKFREMCAADAYSWVQTGYKASELTAEDILDEYPEDAFTPYPEECGEDEKAFTTEEIAQYTLDYMQEIEDGVYDK
ncbi:MAG: hypothetical protein IIZ78_00500 [Clostridiales bacterium]|nr:hypothetical protein [Clostridiales bacterium]